jgi:hypothetical protein
VELDLGRAVLVAATPYPKKIFNQHQICITD